MGWCVSTYLSFLALLTVSALAAEESYTIVRSELHLQSDDSLLQIFESWRNKHGKLYSSPDEQAKRLDIFKSNFEYVSRHNSQTNAFSYWLGLNKFADLTNEEFKASFSMKVRIPRRGSVADTTEKCEEAPSSLDWRTKGVVTGIKSQRNCGTSWAFSSAGAMEAINAMTTGHLVSLSEQELVDCATTNCGCCGGSIDSTFDWVIQNGGISTDAHYPYRGTVGACSISKGEKKVVTIDGYKQVAQSDNALLCATAHQPISVGIVGTSQDFQLYDGGIYDGDRSSKPEDIDHAMLIVGYSSENRKDYWIVKNSWGSDWGINGYVYIGRNTGSEHGVAAINAMASYPSSRLERILVSLTTITSTTSVKCGGSFKCKAGEKCCEKCRGQCTSECQVFDCCEVENAVCCPNTSFCCPSDYPVCDVERNKCLKASGDQMGVEIKKRRKSIWEREHEDEL